MTLINVHVFLYVWVNACMRGCMHVYVCISYMTDRLVLSITDPSYEQIDQLGAQNEAVEGEWSEALLHGPLLTGRLIWVQVGVGSIPAQIVQHNKFGN